MNDLAPPVRRGDFFYSSMLYADVGNGNHHPRATVSEIAMLLRPEPRAQQSATPAKDKFWHWYTAQLLHYGLPSTSNKNTAKVRLLDAISQCKLEVPAWILNVETELKKEWEKETAKLKKAKGNTKREKDVRGTQASKNGVNVTVNLSLSSGLSMAEQLALMESTGAGKAPPKTSAGKRKREDAGPPKSTPSKRTASSTRPLLPPVSPYSSNQRDNWDQTYSAFQRSPTKKPRVKKDTTSVQPRFKQKYGNTSSPPSHFGVKQEYGHRALSQDVKQEYGYGGSPQNVKQKYSYQPPPYNAPSTFSPYDQTPEYHNITLSGTYTITCPIATIALPSINHNTLTLTLYKDSPRGVWWASFCWGAWDCIIQMNPGPSFKTLGQACSLGWRLKDLETGELKFGRKCTGEMWVYSNQEIRGTLWGFPGVGEVEFEGVRMNGEGVGERDGDQFQREWEGFIKEAYGRK